MDIPKNVKQLHGFIGMVNYYHDMWPHWAHILAKKVLKQVNLTPTMQKAFDQMKALMAQDVLCAYPNHNEPFEIYTDASDLQMGSCIMQNGHPVAYCRKT